MSTSPRITLEANLDEAVANSRRASNPSGEILSLGFGIIEAIFKTPKPQPKNDWYVPYVMVGILIAIPGTIFGLGFLAGFAYRK
jgi:hypothetical protein